jgi:hypothetical protein
MFGMASGAAVTIGEGAVRRSSLLLFLQVCRWCSSTVISAFLSGIFVPSSTVVILIFLTHFDLLDLSSKPLGLSSWRAIYRFEFKQPLESNFTTIFKRFSRILWISLNRWGTIFASISISESLCGIHNVKSKLFNMFVFSFYWCFTVVSWSHCKNRERIEGTVKAHGCCHIDPWC